ncbi:MAG: heme NO-binding domain-containing protein [bacterium]
MKGIINKGIQDFVKNKFGDEAWGKITAPAGCEESFFAITFDYPDEMTISLVKAVSEVSEFPIETVMLEYGRFMVQNTLKENYPTYFQLAGNNPRDFLLNMSKVHEHATRSISKSAPPKFEYEEMPDGKLRMYYYSERGLCTVLRGLILGVGDYFNHKLEVEEVECKHNGADHCIMEVTFNGR